MAAEPSASEEPSVVEGERCGFAPHLLTEDFDRAASRCPDRAAFHMDGRDFTYGDLHRAAGRLASRLAVTRARACAHATHDIRIIMMIE